MKPEELERFEPFSFTVRDYYATGQEYVLHNYAMNRPVNAQLENQIQQWIITQNPQDLIMFNGWNGEDICFTRTLSTNT